MRLLFFVIIVVSFVACENDLSEIERFIAKDDLQIEKAKEVSILYSDSAIVRIRIDAPVLHNYLDVVEPRKIFPEGVSVEFFDEKAEVQSQLTAQYAIHYTKLSQLVARDSVMVISPYNEKLETEELIWDDKKQQIYSDKFVKVSTLDEIIYGYGFRANQDFTSWEIRKVQGRFKIKNTQRMN